MRRKSRSQSVESIRKCSCFQTKKNMKQKSKNCKSCEVVSKLFFPQDMMFNILSLLPLHCLLNSARYICKHWATIIRSSLFAEARFKPGLYVENRGSQSSSYFLDIVDDVNGHFKFERIDLGTPQGMGSLVGSCDGILLLCDLDKQIFVVNPILKCHLRIPRLSCTRTCEFTMVRVPHTTMFKLFFIDVLIVSGAFWFVFYVLRVGIDNSLIEIARKKSLYMWYFLGEPLYSGGNDLYYITMEGIIVVDVDREIIVGEYPLLPLHRIGYNPTPTFLFVGDRLFGIVCTNIPHKTLFQIYILNFDSRKLSLYHEMEPFDYMVACGHKINVLNVGVRLWINDQIIIEVYYTKKKREMHNMHFSYNVKTRRFKKIEDIVEDSIIKVWLHTNSLISLPNTTT